jgi:hypothetical protein
VRHPTANRAYDAELVRLLKRQLYPRLVLGTEPGGEAEILPRVGVQGLRKSVRRP